MKGFRDALKNITLITQFGLSLITPVLLCIGLCWFLCNRYQIGGWVYILGFFFGIGASFMTAYKFYLAEMNRQKKEEKPKISFNRH